jgi:hypothetical protein
VTVPSLVQVPPIAGLSVRPKQTPSAVSVVPPLEVTLPPPVAVVEVMPVIVVVVTVGKANVVNVVSVP